MQTEKKAIKCTPAQGPFKKKNHGNMGKINK
jgi:hypothetical protein